MSCFTVFLDVATDHKVQVRATEAEQCRWGSGVPKKFASKRRAAVNANDDDDGSGTARCRCVDVSVDEFPHFHCARLVLWRVANCRQVNHQYVTNHRGQHSLLLTGTVTW